MANDDIPNLGPKSTGERLSAEDSPIGSSKTNGEIPGPLASEVYESNAPLIFDVVSWFLPQSSVNDAIHDIAHDLAAEIPVVGYHRYANLVLIKIIYEHLKANAKSPLELGFEEAFGLFLRERYGLSCKEIGSIVGSSEGSIRTRLERARARAFAKPISDSIPATTAGHACIRIREQVEDWNAAETRFGSARMGELSAPASVERAVSVCNKCEQTLRQRLASNAYFRDLPQLELPEALIKFPVSPLFVKEGKRLMFNWAAAPWYIKALFEGLLATTLVLGVVLSIPRIKGLYEFWLERRLDLYSVAELAAGLGTPHDTADDATRAKDESQAIAKAVATVETSNLGPMPLPPVDHSGVKSDAGNTSVKPESEFVGRDSEVITSDRIYRILIKTDSPETIRDHALRLLTNIKYVAYDKDSVGAELPGGVMFDIFIPIKNYKQLVAELTRLGESKVIITRAKERGMAGKARVKIWLQRI